MQTPDCCLAAVGRMKESLPKNHPVPCYALRIGISSAALLSNFCLATNDSDLLT